MCGFHHLHTQKHEIKLKKNNNKKCIWSYVQTKERLQYAYFLESFLDFPFTLFYSVFTYIHNFARTIKRLLEILLKTYKYFHLRLKISFYDFIIRYSVDLKLIARLLSLPLKSFLLIKNSLLLLFLVFVYVLHFQWQPNVFKRFSGT